MGLRSIYGIPTQGKNAATLSDSELADEIFRASILAEAVKRHDDYLAWVQKNVKVPGGSPKIDRESHIAANVNFLMDELLTDANLKNLLALAGERAADTADKDLKNIAAITRAFNAEHAQAPLHYIAERLMQELDEGHRHRITITKERKAPTTYCGVPFKGRDAKDLSNEELARELMNVAYIEVRMAYDIGNDMPGHYKADYRDTVSTLETNGRIEPLVQELGKRIKRFDGANSPAIEQLRDFHAAVSKSAAKESFGVAKSILERRIPDVHEEMELRQFAWVVTDFMQRRFLENAKPTGRAPH